MVSKVLTTDKLSSGRVKMDGTVGYLGVEPEDALAIAEAIEINDWAVSRTVITDPFKSCKKLLLLCSC